MGKGEDRTLYSWSDFLFPVNNPLGLSTPTFQILPDSSDLPGHCLFMGMTWASHTVEGLVSQKNSIPDLILYAHHHQTSAFPPTTINPLANIDIHEPRIRSISLSSNTRMHLEAVLVSAILSFSLQMFIYRELINFGICEYWTKRKLVFTPNKCGGIPKALMLMFEMSKFFKSKPQEKMANDLPRQTEWPEKSENLGQVCCF